MPQQIKSPLDRVKLDKSLWTAAALPVQDGSNGNCSGAGDYAETRKFFTSGQAGRCAGLSFGTRTQRLRATAGGSR